MDLKDYVTTIPDFPKPGIMFRDITTVVSSPEGLKMAIDQMVESLKDVDFDLVAGSESRGFVFGTPVAYAMGKGFVLVRKKGKLPRETISEEYALEYGTATLEMHRDAIKPGQKVVIVDDLIATGGTTEAMVRMIERLGGKVVKICFVMELAGLGGRKKLSGYDVESLITYEGKRMKVTSGGIDGNGFFLDRYGCKGNDFIDGMPSLSFPFRIEDAPEGTVSFAFIFDDYDAAAVSGFDWIHWTGAGLKKTEVEEGASRRDPGFTEGRNSWCGALDRFPVEKATGYGGMAPPDRTHRYTLKVFALDCDLSLEKGFPIADLVFGMMDHILGYAVLVGKYSPKNQRNRSFSGPAGI